MEKKSESNTSKGKEKTKNAYLKSSKKLTREERRKLREKRRAEEGMPTKMNRYLWFVIIFAGIVTFFDGWCTLAITLAMGNVGSEEINLDLGQLLYNEDFLFYFGLGNTPVTMGLILSIAGIGVILAVSFKYLVDKYGRRPLTLITAIAFITFTVLTSLTPPGSDGLIIFLILRIGANYFLSADIVLIITAEESPDHLRGRLIGAILATNAVGGFACGVFQAIGINIPIPGPWGIGGTYVGQMTVWQSLFFLTSIGYFMIIPLFFFLKETKRFTAMKKYEKWRKKRGLKPKTGWFVPLQKKYIRPIALGCIMGFLMQLIYFAHVTFFALYYAKEQNVGSLMVGVISLPHMVSAAIGSYSGGPLIDRWGRLPTIHRAGIGSLLFGVLFSWPTVFIVGDLANPLLLILVLIGGVIGIFWLTVLTTAVTIIPIEMMPTHIRSTAMGWVGAISRGAVMLAPLLMMFGSEKVGGLGLSYQYMFVLMGFALSTILFCAYLLAPESKGRLLEELVATEVYGKMKKVTTKEFRRPYYFYWLGLVTGVICLLIYSMTTYGTPTEIVTMVTIYMSMSVACFFLIMYVRKIVTEQEKK